MLDPRNVSWTHFNKARRFPLMFDSVPVSTDGLFTIPDDLIVSLYLSCNVSGEYSDPGLFYIGSLTYYHTGLVIEIYYGGSGEKVAETTVDLSTGKLPEVVQLFARNPLVLSGILVLGGIDGLSRQPAGEWIFEPSAAQIDPFCVRYVAKELSELYVRSRGQTLGPFHGTVTFEEGDNIVLGIRTDGDLNCLDPSLSGTGTEVVIHALDANASSPCIRTINGVKPDRAGNINFVGQNCLKISPEGQHTLVFTDTCSEPCCTCAELAPIEAAIKEITVSISQLSSRMETLNTQHDFLLHSISASN